MSGLLQELKKASAAIEVNRAAAEVKGRNIANVSNQNYARQEIVIQSLGTYDGPYGPSSFGVGVESIYHVRNEILDEAITNLKMTSGSLEAQEFYAENIEAHFRAEVGNLGDTSDAPLVSGLSQTIDALFTIFDSLSANPGQTIYKTKIYNAGDNLVGQFNALDKHLTTIDNSIVKDASTSAQTVNAILEKIAGLNKSIYGYESTSPYEAMDDRDLRQKALEDLSAYMDFRVEASTQHKGSLTIIVKDVSNMDVVLVESHSVKRKLAFDGTDFTTDEATPIVLSFAAGRFHGLKTTREGTLPNFRTELDDLAHQFVLGINAAYNPTAATGDFFDPSGLTAGTISLDPALTKSNIKSSDTGNSGANEIALAVADLKRHTFSIGSGDIIDGTYNEKFADSIVSLGYEVNQIRQKLETQSLLEASYKERRDSETAVSLNEETADLFIIQKALQANAVYLRIIGELLDEIMKVI